MAVEAAATALAAGGIPEVSIAFDEDVVGSFGAGFAWHGPVHKQPDTHQAGHDGDSEAGDFMQVVSPSITNCVQQPCTMLWAVPFQAAEAAIFYCTCRMR